ncbi:MAG: starch-binding protein [Paludibacteraceae bacterium]|nr:starch-binding protein [Paludibacteraceae bacterium]
MKVNKLFLGAMLVASVAMISCKKNNKQEPAIIDPGTEPQEIQIPSIAAPAAGKTTIAFYAEVCPRGAYLVGSHNGYNIADDSFSFEKVAGEDNWWALTIDYAADLQAKVIARPSDADVPLAWSYQWGKCYDASDPNCTVKEGEDNTVILQGQGEWAFENGGEVKLSNVADGGVVYIQVKNWNASPIIEAKKLETCWIKSNFNGADWAWYEMTAKGDGVFEFEGVWGGNGCNINSVGEDGGAAWYPDPEKVGDPASGDKVKVTFVSEKMTVGKLTIELLEKGETPVDPTIPTTRDQEQPITVTGIVPEGWAKCFLWAWEAGDKNVFAAWPGQELPIENGKVSYTFDDAVQVINVIFSNGDGVQTKNIENLNKDTEINIAENLQ